MLDWIILQVLRSGISEFFSALVKENLSDLYQISGVSGDEISKFSSTMVKKIFLVYANIVSKII